DLTDAEIDRRLQELFKASPGLTVAEIRRRLQEFKTSPDLTVAKINRRLQESIESFADLTVAESRRRLHEFKTSPDLTVAEISRRMQEFKASHIVGIIDLTDADIQHDVTLVDLAVGTDRDLAKDANASLLLHNAKLGGSVRLFLTAE